MTGNMESNPEMEREAQAPAPEAPEGEGRRDDGPKPPPNPYGDPMNTEPPRAPEPPPMGGPQRNAPPYGTYPPPNGPMPPYAPPEPPKKTRRVGTLTMALCLIAVGVLLIMRVFLPNIDYLFIARLSPVVLILLGLEMIVANARHKEEKLRYDVLSVFISLLLIGASLVATVIPEVVTYSMNYNQVSSRLSASLDVASADLITEHTDLPVYNVSWYIGLNGVGYDSDMSFNDLRAEDNIQVQVFMPGNYKDGAAFAKDCRTALDYLLTMVPHINYASFYDSRSNDYSAYDGDVRYGLWLDGTAAMRQSAEQMAGQVEIEMWDEESRYYLSEVEYRERAEAMKEELAALDEPDDSGIEPPESESVSELDDSMMDDAA